MGNTSSNKKCKRCTRFYKGSGEYCKLNDCYNKAGYSKKAIQWLDSVSHKIQHAERGGEKEIDITTKMRNGRIKTYTFKVDGYYKGTVYEFYGDYFHGNPTKYNADDIGPGGNTFGSLYIKTKWRENLLKGKYKVITMWESTYDNK
uniref:Uncharacterized protein n=1 Tax=Pithovirus LCPAC101 TaxID=2506586 RepID=A0A481Z376_9VIRU|nr:MAG: hypothetical protein LCPAC101_01870 [Pithovirus LCPAC101]